MVEGSESMLIKELFNEADRQTKVAQTNYQRAYKQTCDLEHEYLISHEHLATAKEAVIATKKYTHDLHICADLFCITKYASIQDLKNAITLPDDCKTLLEFCPDKTLVQQYIMNRFCVD